MSATGSPPLTPTPGPDFDDRDVLETYIRTNYRRLVNRINIRDFLPKLREKGFKMADQEEVQHVVTSVDRAMMLIDIVLRKDTPCLKVFMEVLEYDYEDLYLRITGCKSRQRPPSWRQEERRASRRSMQALTGIMETMSGILTELTKNHNTMQNLASQVQGVCTKSTQEQKNEDQHLDKMKETLNRLKAENVTVMWENKVLKTRLENERKKTKKLSSADERLLQLRRELRDKEEQLQQMKSEGDNQKMQETSRQTPVMDHRLKTLIQQNIEMERDLRNEQEENKQMQHDLDESEKEIKNLTERVDDLSEDNMSLRTKLDELETHCYWLERKEKRQQNMESPIYHANTLGRECIEEEPEDESDYTTVNPGSRPILRQASVGARTNITANLDRLSRKLSASLCLSEDATMNYQQEKLDVSDLIQWDFISQDVMRGTVCSVEVAATDILDMITLAGGNHCGIFISSLKNTDWARENKVKVGDHLMKVQPSGSDDSSDICLGDCTLEDAHNVLQKETGRVQLFLWSGGELYKKFMNRKNKDYKGDLFCVQVNSRPVAMEIDGTQQALAYGDILLVLNTLVQNGSTKKWHIRKLEPHFGKWQDPKLAGFVPSAKVSIKKITSTRGHSLGVETKNKGLYTYVKPYMHEHFTYVFVLVSMCVLLANYARPVLLFGERVGITAVLNVASSDQQFKLDTKHDDRPGYFAEKIMNQIILYERMHMIVEANLELLNDLMKRKIYPIVVRVKSDCGSRKVEDPLKDCALPKCSIEELELTDKTLTVKEDILKFLKSLVTQAQRHLIWLDRKHPSVPTH